MGGLLGGLISGAASAYNAQQAFERQKTILRNRVQWNVQDLRKAGLNPLLAAQRGIGGGGSASVAMAQTPDFASAMSRDEAQRMERPVKNAQTGLLQAQASNQNAQALAAKNQAAVNAENAKSIAQARDLQRFMFPEAQANAAMYGTGGALLKGALLAKQLGIPLGWVRLLGLGGAMATMSGGDAGTTTETGPTNASTVERPLGFGRGSEAISDRENDGRRKWWQGPDEYHRQLRKQQRNRGQRR